MNRLLCLPRIRGYWAFREYRWPTDLHRFAKVNVVYGWNGSGKTTLSSLLEHVQKRQPVSEGEVSFEFEGLGRVEGNALASRPVPPTRVFHRPFVERTIRMSDTGVDHIYYFGEDSVEKREEVERLKAELDQTEKALEEARKDHSTAKRDLERFGTEQAKSINTLLLGAPEYKNYRRPNFENAMTELEQDQDEFVPLSNAERAQLDQQRRASALPGVSRCQLSTPPVVELAHRTGELLKRTVVSEVLTDLAERPSVAKWVRQGLELHDGESHRDACWFCGGTISDHRRRELAGHFNDAYERFMSDIEQLIGDLDRLLSSLDRQSLPAPHEFYPNQQQDADAACAMVLTASRAVGDILNRLRDELVKKRARPFQALALELGDAELTSASLALDESVRAVNAVVDEQRRATENLATSRQYACKSLELDALRAVADEYRDLVEGVRRHGGDVSALEAKPTRLQEEIALLEAAIVESRRPAEELNRELASYLGRDELHFEFRDKGYVLLRHGHPAKNLSEGEKTAIALLYFLKSLQDRSFDLANGIVVIDDPVSSLDANALYSAFSYVKNRTKDAGQLFLLTHNFQFFRLVRGWVRHLPNQNKKDLTVQPGRFFWISAERDADGKRASTLGPLDPMLNEFESEYQFLFRCVRDAAERTNGDQLEPLYGLPNIGRRLLEAFVAFKLPGSKKNLWTRLESLGGPAEHRARVYGYLNDFSHADRVAAPEIDPYLLAGGPEVMRSLLELIKALDPQHYDSLEEYITTDRASRARS